MILHCHEKFEINYKNSQFNRTFLVRSYNDNNYLHKSKINNYIMGNDFSCFQDTVLNISFSQNSI